MCQSCGYQVWRSMLKGKAIKIKTEELIVFLCSCRFSHSYRWLIKVPEIRRLTINKLSLEDFNVFGIGESVHEIVRILWFTETKKGGPAAAHQNDLEIVVSKNRKSQTIVGGGVKTRHDTNIKIEFALWTYIETLCTKLFFQSLETW